MHDDAYIGGRSGDNINASCMTILGGRTEQLDIFCRVTGFTSDFLSFIDVELIRFFHGALQSYICFMEWNCGNDILSISRLQFSHIECKELFFRYP